MGQTTSSEYQLLEDSTNARIYFRKVRKEILKAKKQGEISMKVNSEKMSLKAQKEGINLLKIYSKPEISCVILLNEGENVALFRWDEKIKIERLLPISNKLQ